MTAINSIASRGNRVSSLSSFLLVPVGMSLLALCGCATILSNSEYPVNIDSVPSNMEIVVTDSNGDIEYRGQTPTVVDLDAHGGYFVREIYTVELYDAGKVVGKTTVDGSIDSHYFLNLVGWSVIGLIVVDPMTGAMWTLEKDVVVFRDVETSEAKSSP